MFSALYVVMFPMVLILNDKGRGLCKPVLCDTGFLLLVCFPPSEFAEMLQIPKKKPQTFFFLKQCN